ncbi:LuxR C-terminal-related transcriptional regulator [Streptomyces sp. NPDC088925]|uniref:helix-turn-helix transcriptional regulator n=1 Tax=Streptomyces sp. NPDC088925 TaxID=3365914 RepID=UPI00380E56F4
MSDDMAPIGAELMQTYRQVAAGHDARPDEIQALQDAGLAEPAPLGVTLRDPRAVVHARMDAALSQLAAATAAMRGVATVMAETPSLTALHHHYDAGRFFGGQASEFLGTGREMNDRINEVIEVAEREILAAQPGAPVDRDPAIVTLGTERSVRALARGISVYGLYNRLVASHVQARAAAEAVVEAGGEAKALPPVFPRMVCVDSRHLFIDNLVGPGESNCGWHVTDPASVAWARSVFWHAWARATPWAELELQTSGPVSERQRQVLDLLAAGQSQSQIGTRLGISRRTVENELAAVREELRMETTFQVMAWWGAQREGRA